MIVIEQPGGEHYTIRPCEIALTPAGAVQGGFGKQQIERVAGHLVRFFQEKEAWISFTLDELKDFFAAHDWDTENPLCGLTGHWVDDGEDVAGRRWNSEVFVYFLEEDICAVTDSFIRRCAGLAHH